MSAATAAAAADRKARLAAKAAKQSQKPLGAGGVRSTFADDEDTDRSRPAETPKQSVARASGQSLPVPTTNYQQSSSQQAGGAPTGGNASYGAYTEDLGDDMDATMYLDAGVNALQLTKKTPARQMLAEGSPNRNRWEDEVEAFQAGTPSHQRPNADNFSPSSKDLARNQRPIAPLDSAAEEMRLDALRRQQRGDEEGSDFSPSNAASSQGGPNGSGWVDPQTRLTYVKARQGEGAAGAQGYDDDEGEGEGVVREGEEDQPYLRQSEKALLDQNEALRAAASASSSSSANDPQTLAYQRQLQLQQEQNAIMAQKAASGELSAEDQRLMLMRQKRPPLILDWGKVNTKEFFTQAVPRGGWVQCRLIKRTSGFSAFLHPRYEFYTEEHQGGLFLATARKSSKTKPNYHLTTEKFQKGEDKSIEKSSAGYSGKVAATLSRSDYVVYDSGFNPNKSGDQSFSGQPREEVGAISYKPHLSGKTPRKLAVLLPILFPDSHKDSFVNKEFKNEFLSQSLAYQHLWKNLKECQQRARVPRAWLCLLNKPPRYHADTGQYVLDFCGRAPQVSVKNFQLVYPEEPDEVLFQLGRIDDDNFSVDFRFPLSPNQAFAIALSSLDYKWTVD